MEQQKLQLAVAKAAFSASLSLPSDPKVSPQLVAAFQSLLTAVTSQCSQRNVKDTRIWILENCKSAKQVTFSAAVRFLSALSATLPTFKERLSLLYVLNDVLFHATTTFRETKTYVPSAALQHLPALVKTIRSALEAQSEPLNKVIKLWSEKKYFTPEEFAQITETPLREDTAVKEEEKVKRRPLVKPSMLGNMGDPHWLLPVSCMLEVMEYSNNYKPIFPASVKAVKLSETTDPELLERVETLETSVHEWKFKEEEGSEGDELFDGEGWDLSFWNNREERQLKRTQERLRSQLMDKMGRLNKSSTATRKRSPSPASVSGSSRSRSPSPARGRRRERSYSYSPPPRRKRGRSRSISGSPSPKRRWSPPPPHESVPHKGHNHPPSHPPTQPSYPAGPPSQPQQYHMPPQGYQGYPQQYPYPPPPPPPQTGYYRSDIPLNQPAHWDQRGHAPPHAAPWSQNPPTGPQEQNYGRGSYSQRGHSQHRKWP